MAQFIDKDVLVAEIEKRRSNLISLSESCPANTAGRAGFYAQAQTLEGIKNFINALEVKDESFKPMDSDFERDAVSFCLDNGLNTTPYIAKTIAKHFFELGLAQNENCL